METTPARADLMVVLSSERYRLQPQTQPNEAFQGPDILRGSSCRPWWEGSCCKLGELGNWAGPITHLSDTLLIPTIRHRCADPWPRPSDETNLGGGGDICKDI